MYFRFAAIGVLIVRGGVRPKVPACVSSSAFTPRCCIARPISGLFLCFRILSFIQEVVARADPVYAACLFASFPVRLFSSYTVRRAFLCPYPYTVVTPCIFAGHVGAGVWVCLIPRRLRADRHAHPLKCDAQFLLGCLPNIVFHSSVLRFSCRE